MTRYRGHMTITRDIVVEFEVEEKKGVRYKALQTAAIEKAIELRLIDIERDGVSIPWVDGVMETPQNEKAELERMMRDADRGEKYADD